MDVASHLLHGQPLQLLYDMVDSALQVKAQPCRHWLPITQECTFEVSKPSGGSVSLSSTHLLQDHIFSENNAASPPERFLVHN